MQFQVGVALVFFLAMISQGLSQNATNLLCYDCDPQNSAEQCLEPVRNGVQHTNCHLKFPERDPNSTLICLSANLTYSGEQRSNTGIYRGCYVQDVSVTSFCDWFRQETDSRNASMISCVTCNSTRCNNVTFNADGQPNKSSSLLNLAFAVVAVSFLFSTLF